MSIDTKSKALSYDQDLDPGANGPAVVDMQEKLLRLGFDLGGYGATGYFGSYTVAALKAIQKYKGFPLVGRYGPGTRKAVTELLSQLDASNNYPGKSTILGYYKEFSNGSSGSGSSSTEDLDPGESGDKVTEMQKKLLKLGFDLGGYGATGYFGSYTVSALKAIQAFKGFEIVGRYGPSTRKAVEELVSKVDFLGDYPEKQGLLNKYSEMLSNNDLDPGASGEAVTILQNKLLKLGFDLGGYGATGYFGNYTVAALKVIQAFKGFEIVGRYGPSTRKAVEELLSKVDSFGYYPEKQELLNKYNDMLTNVDLDPGASGDIVKEVQKKLLRLGFDLGGYGATGYFGNYTVAAMKAIQDLKGYEVVGRYGPKTREAVSELLKSIDDFGDYPSKKQLISLYNKYVKQFAAIDEVIDLNGSYKGQQVYFAQDDPKWGQKMYGSNTIEKSGCGPSAMSIVVSSMTGNIIDPPTMCQYSLENGYRIEGQGTSSSLFFAAAKKYNLSCRGLSTWDLAEVKKILASGSNMVIALMKAGHFTKGGHYIVLTGIETSFGKNYFTVLDPHMDNENYPSDNMLIDEIKNDGRVTANTAVFASQCLGYWVFAKTSSSQSSDNDPIVKAKYNLEKLGYTNLRNSNGDLTNIWDKNFDNALWNFMEDYNLKKTYTELPTSEKTSKLFMWLDQAVKGIIHPVTNPGTDGILTDENIVYGVGKVNYEVTRELGKIHTEVQVKLATKYNIAMETVITGGGREPGKTNGYADLTDLSKDLIWEVKYDIEPWNEPLGIGRKQLLRYIEATNLYPQINNTSILRPLTPRVPVTVKALSAGYPIMVESFVTSYFGQNFRVKVRYGDNKVNPLESAMVYYSIKKEKQEQEQEEVSTVDVYVEKNTGEEKNKVLVKVGKGLVIAGEVLLAATLLEDVATGGVGAVDDIVTVPFSALLKKCGKLVLKLAI